MYPLLLLIQAVRGIPLLQNITIPLPTGTSNHNTPGLLCTPTKWTDIVIFYLANYAAHAATTRSLPGESTIAVAFIVLTALFFPAFGAYRGFLGITSGAMFRKTDLEKAVAAGALCMLVRTSEWRPQNGDTLHNTIVLAPPSGTKLINHSVENNLPATSVEDGQVLDTITAEFAHTSAVVITYDPPWLCIEEEAVVDHGTTSLHIHGYHNIPPGYRFWLVPRRATIIKPDQGSHNVDMGSISYNYSLVKILVSLGQSIYAILTLYRARGDQIAQFGYAAFGLTVAPYAVASTLNFFGSLFCPEFPMIYMVESSIMEEARRRGDEYAFEGTVGKLDELVMPYDTMPAVEGSLARVLESVTINVDSSGTSHVNTGAQDELSGMTTRRPKVPLAAALEGLGSRKPIPVAWLGSLGNRQLQLENIRLANLERMTSLDKVGTLLWHANEPPHNTVRNSEPSNPPLENVLLVPLVNPMNRKGMDGQVHDWKIYNIAPGSGPGVAWKVEILFQDNDEDMNDFNSFYKGFASIALNTAIPIAINGALSSFHKGHSTHAQRVWTMTWLGFGALGPFLSWYAEIYVTILLDHLVPTQQKVPKVQSTDSKISTSLRYALLVSVILVYAGPAIGGFVVVGQMLKSYGTCVTVS